MKIEYNFFLYSIIISLCGDLIGVVRSFIGRVLFSTSPPTLSLPPPSSSIASLVDRPSKFFIPLILTPSPSIVFLPLILVFLPLIITTAITTTIATMSSVKSVSKNAAAAATTTTTPVATAKHGIIPSITRWCTFGKKCYGGRDCLASRHPHVVHSIPSGFAKCNSTRPNGDQCDVVILAGEGECFRCRGKTILCFHRTVGKCKHGNTCRFLHSFPDGFKKCDNDGCLRVIANDLDFCLSCQPRHLCANEDCDNEIPLHFTYCRSCIDAYNEEQSKIPTHHKCSTADCETQIPMVHQYCFQCNKAYLKTKTRVCRTDGCGTKIPGQYTYCLACQQAYDAQFNQEAEDEDEDEDEDEEEKLEEKVAVTSPPTVPPTNTNPAAPATTTIVFAPTAGNGSLAPIIVPPHPTNPSAVPLYTVTTYYGMPVGPNHSLVQPH